MRKLIILALGIAILSACGTGSEEPDVKVVRKAKEVKAIKAGDDISSIIRNPVSANEIVDTVNIPRMIFEETRYQFGTVNEGDIVKHVFKFTNEGKAPLLISHAKSTCGCTVPEWPEAPIAPGESGVISVRFDTKNKKGRQGKPITILANTNPRETFLQLVGEVIPKKD